MCVCKELIALHAYAKLTKHMYPTREWAASYHKFRMKERKVFNLLVDLRTRRLTRDNLFAVAPGEIFDPVHVVAFMSAFFELSAVFCNEKSFILRFRSLIPAPASQINQNCLHFCRNMWCFCITHSETRECRWMSDGDGESPAPSLLQTTAAAKALGLMIQVLNCCDGKPVAAFREVTGFM